MPLLDLLLARSQPGYEPSITAIAERWDRLLGESALDGVDANDFAACVVQRMQGPDAGPILLQVISDLFALAWWCGLRVDDDVYAQVGDLVRRRMAVDLQALVPPKTPITVRPTRHAVITGALEGPKHSPSRGAVDYVCALGSDPDVQHIDLYYTGELRAPMLEYMQARMGGLGDRLNLVSLDNPNALGLAVSRRPYIYHLWCPRPLDIRISLLATLGPTVMFTCGDEPPFQYADLYWYFHEPDYIQRTWRRKGAPQAFIDNYRPCDEGPNPNTPVAKGRTKLEFGLSAETVVIATVGNRLAVDMDETFIVGMEATLRAHPAARWLVIGALPDYLLSACRQVLGAQFAHIAYEPELGALMGAVDIFANPFRRGGGDSAMTAITQGVVALTRGDTGDVRGFVPAAHRAEGPDDYFARLARLIADEDLRSMWRDAQRAKAAVLVDQAAFTASLRAMADVAFERYRARGRAPMAAIFPVEAETWAA